MQNVAGSKEGMWETCRAFEGKCRRRLINYPHDKITNNKNVINHYYQRTYSSYFLVLSHNLLALAYTSILTSIEIHSTQMYVPIMKLWL